MRSIRELIIDIIHDTIQKNDSSLYSVLEQNNIYIYKYQKGILELQEAIRISIAAGKCTVSFFLRKKESLKFSTKLIPVSELKEFVRRNIT